MILYSNARTRLTWGLILLLGIYACASETLGNNSEDEQVQALSGTYVLTELITDQPSTFNKGGSAPYNLVEELPCLLIRKELRADRTTSGVVTEMLQAMGADANLSFQCGSEKEVPAGTWRVSGNTVVTDEEIFRISGKQLIAERDPESNDFYRLVFTRQ